MTTPTTPPSRVEVVGPPGAGKSTFVASLTADAAAVGRPEALLDAMRSGLRDRVVRRSLTLLPRRAAIRLAERAFLRSHDFPHAHSRFATCHPELHLVVAEMSTMSLLADARPGLLLHKHAIVQASYQFLAESPGPSSRTLVADEELVQMLLLGAANSREPTAMIERYLTWCPLPDVVVAVRTRPDLCAERIETRPGSGWPTIIRSGDGIGFLERAEGVYDQVLEGVRARGARVVEVDNATEAEPGRVPSSLASTVFEPLPG